MAKIKKKMEHTHESFAIVKMKREFHLYLTGSRSDLPWYAYTESQYGGIQELINSAEVSDELQLRNLPDRNKFPLYLTGSAWSPDGSALSSIAATYEPAIEALSRSSETGNEFSLNTASRKTKEFPLYLTGSQWSPDGSYSYVESLYGGIEALYKSSETSSELETNDTFRQSRQFPLYLTGSRSDLPFYAYTESLYGGIQELINSSEASIELLQAVSQQINKFPLYLSVNSWNASTFPESEYSAVEALIRSGEISSELGLFASFSALQKFSLYLTASSWSPSAAYTFTESVYPAIEQLIKSADSADLAFRLIEKNKQFPLYLTASAWSPSSSYTFTESLFGGIDALVRSGEAAFSLLSAQDKKARNDFFLYPPWNIQSPAAVFTFTESLFPPIVQLASSFMSRSGVTNITQYLSKSMDSPITTQRRRKFPPGRRRLITVMRI